MIKNIGIGILFMGALLLESSLFSVPFLLSGLLLLFVFTKKPSVFFIGFILGIFLDSLLVRLLGSTSIFFLLFLVVIFLYDRKFEVLSLPFVLTIGVVGNILYALYFDTPSLIIQLLITVITIFSGYILTRKFSQKKTQTNFQRV